MKWTNIATMIAFVFMTNVLMVGRVAPSTIHQTKTETRPETKIESHKHMFIGPVLRNHQKPASRGESLNVNPWIDGIATWYDGQDDGLNGSGAGLTATGTKPTNGRTAAVDPSIIPYGSHIEVLFDDGTIEYLVAEDTGGAIRGNRIDIYDSNRSECLANGRKHVKIRIL